MPDLAGVGTVTGEKMSEEHRGSGLLNEVRGLLRSLFAMHFIRFSIVGTGGFTVDEVVLALLHYGLGLDKYTARIVSISVAATFTWWGNRTFTFHAHAAKGSAAALISEWARFMGANAIGAAFNYGTYFVCVTFGSGLLRNPLIATVIGVGIGLLFNFTLSKHVVFRAQPAVQPRNK